MEHAISVKRAYADRSTLNSRLNAMNQGVLQQRLQRQLRNGQIIWNAFHLPLHLQSVTEPVTLDGQIAPRQLQLLAPGHQRAGTSQAGPKQIGKVQHRLLGLALIGGYQTGDAVQAVEQEMRANPCLQRLDAGPQLGLLLPSPLALQVKVAQQ